MMTFRKSVRNSGKRTSYFHCNNVQKCKQYQGYKDKNFFERPSDA